MTQLFRSSFRVNSRLSNVFFFFFIQRKWTFFCSIIQVQEIIKNNGGRRNNSEENVSKCELDLASNFYVWVYALKASSSVSLGFTPPPLRSSPRFALTQCTEAPRPSKRMNKSLRMNFEARKYNLKKNRPSGPQNIDAWGKTIFHIKLMRV